MEQGSSSSHRGHFHLIVHAARGLPAADLHILKKSSSDPYCIVSFANQRFRTQTIYSNLNPVWEEAFSFQLGSFLPKTILWLFGDEHKEPCEDPVLELSILDEDLITADDALGECRLEAHDILQEPERWHTYELAVTSGGSQCGTITISVCWEPAPFLPPYATRMVSVIGYACSFVMFLLSANCAWQPGKLEDGAVKQPGVGATLLVGSGCMLLATCVQFVATHMDSNARIDDLVGSHSASRGLNDALQAHGLPRNSAKAKSSSGGPPLLTVKLKASGLGSYELGIMPNVDITKHLHLPVIVINWLLPLGGVALSNIAMALQFWQERSWSIFPGQVFNIVALLSSAAGWAFAFMAETRPKVWAKQGIDQSRVFREKTAILASPAKKEPMLRRMFTRSPQ